MDAAYGEKAAFAMARALEKDSSLRDFYITHRIYTWLCELTIDSSSFWRATAG
jgi:hypothetical protein